MDPRIARTRASLQSALLELTREQHVDEISVAVIAERAGVNRSSFYQHYSDKDTLLADAIDAVLAEARVDIAPPTAISAQPPSILEAYFRHVEEHAGAYALMFGEHASAVAAARLRMRIQTIVSETLIAARGRDFDDIPVEVLAAGLTGSVLGVMEAWLARDPRPPVDVAVSWLWIVLRGPQAPLER